MHLSPGAVAVESRDNAAGGVSSVGFVTRGRPDAIVHCVESYVSHAVRYGHAPEFAVMDDTADAPVRSSVRRRLGEVARRHDVSLRYAGLEEKLGFAKKLLGAGAASPETIKFAFFDPERYGITSGANRNAFALEAAGGLALCVDDDTECRAAVPPEMERGLRVVREELLSSTHPCEIWSYPDRRAALAAASFVDIDMFGGVGTWLGRSAVDCVAAARDDGGLEVESGGAWSGALPPDGRVGVVLPGLLGDCGWPTPLFYAWITGRSVARLGAAAGDFHAACSSREMLKVVTRATLADRTTKAPALFMAVDHRGLLPPQFPVARGQDVLFWRCLSKCRPDVVIAHLPWAVLHVPAEPRAFRAHDAARVHHGIELLGLLEVFIEAFPAGGTTDPARRLRALGAYFEEWARRPTADLVGHLREHIFAQTRRIVEELELRLERWGRTAPAWAETARLFVEAQAVAPANDALVPLDLLHRGGPDRAWELARRLLARFGRLLDEWPAILEAAADLRARGERMTRAVEDLS